MLTDTDIYIAFWNGVGQYDEDGNQIVEWDEKACNWFVLPEYEKCHLIYEEDENGITEIPRASIRSECPDVSGCPDISISMDYTYGGQEYHESRYWGHTNYTEDEAIEHFGKKYLNEILGSPEYTRVWVKVLYNGKQIWEGNKSNNINQINI